MARKDFTHPWHHCNYCGTPYLSRKDALEHENSCFLNPNGDDEAAEPSTSGAHTLGGDNCTACRYCRLAYPSIAELNEHERCCSDYTSSEEDEDEDQGKISTTEPDVTLEKSAFLLEETPRTGELVFESDRSLWVQCPFCLLPFYSDGELFAHMNTLHTDELSSLHSPDHGAAETNERNKVRCHCYSHIDIYTYTRTHTHR